MPGVKLWYNVYENIKCGVITKTFIFAVQQACMSIKQCFLIPFECIFEELYENVKHKYEILSCQTHVGGNCVRAAYIAVNGV